MKCQRCPKQATLHITEVLTDDQFEELHFCEHCAKKYLADPPPTATPPAASVAEPVLTSEPVDRFCEACGLKFVEFRNSGRLGCPHDYDGFRDDLLPLLESIHGDTKHQGKRPRRRPTGGSPVEIASLRRKLQKAVQEEAYETAARLRDRIRELEEG